MLRIVARSLTRALSALNSRFEPGTSGAWATIHLFRKLRPEGHTRRLGPLGTHPIVFEGCLVPQVVMFAFPTVCLFQHHRCTSISSLGLESSKRHRMRCRLNSMGIESTFFRPPSGSKRSSFRRRDAAEDPIHQCVDVFEAMKQITVTYGDVRAPKNKSPGGDDHGPGFYGSLRTATALVSPRYSPQLRVPQLMTSLVRPSRSRTCRSRSQFSHCGRPQQYLPDHPQRRGLVAIRDLS